MCRGLFLEIYTITARAPLKAEPALHSVPTENTKLASTVTRQSRVIHCVQGDAGPADAPCCSIQLLPTSHEPLSTIPQPCRDGRGVKGAWKKLQVLCLSSRFASPTLLLSPSPISPFLVIFHHWRRHQVFSWAWNVHSNESSLFCSMCLC